ncbi:MAG: iron-containing alcohol dehydrogenase [Bacteroidetes bacterium]|nr:iron-containing alcohol dehydrogenase [Bacteroidota bacterium]
MNFEFSTTGRIIFGNGSIKQLPGCVKPLGRNALLVCGKKNDRSDSIVDILNSSGVKTSIFNVPNEPTIPLVMQGIHEARSKACDLVIGIGGGSVIDAGKVISAMITNHGELSEYLEVIGEGKNITKTPAPYIAIPTTAGTGAEVTRNAVIASPEHKVKVSMRSPFMYPRIAIVDPELTYSMPPEITVSTGLDALTQLIEAYVSNKANPLTDGICIEGLKRAGRSLSLAYKSGEKSAREDMCVASLFSGLALANAKLGAVHGLAAPLGGLLSAPHGLICARLLPFVIEANVNSLLENGRPSDSLNRFETAAQILTDNIKAKAIDAVNWITKICLEMKIPALKDIGLKESHIPEIVRQAKNSSSTKGNPMELTEEKLTQILQQAM